MQHGSIPSGSRMLTLAVRDDAFVQKGDLLFAIDPRQYEYALQQALAGQKLLEAPITDARRRIAAESIAVEAARAGLSRSETQTKVGESTVEAALAGVERRGLQRFRVLFFIELSARKVAIDGMASADSGRWMSQIGRNLKDAGAGILTGNLGLVRGRHTTSVRPRTN
jgi:multidrug efflux pump subunit AcrA (membrane-fusion protein)